MSPADRRRGFARAGFALLAALFVGLRLFDLTADAPPDLDWSGGIFFDEGMLAQGARNKLLFGGFFQDEWNDFYISPLLSLIKLAVLSVTGVGLLQVRLIPVAFGLASLLLFYLMLRRGAGRGTALTGVVLLGCSHVYGMFNRIGLTETPVSFFMLLAGWLWQEGVLRLGAAAGGGTAAGSAPPPARGFAGPLFGAGAAAFVAYTVKGFPYFMPGMALASVLAWRLLPEGARSLRSRGSRRLAGAAAGALLGGMALPFAAWYLAFYRRFAPSIGQANAFYRAQQVPPSAEALVKDLVTVPFFGYFTVTPALLLYSLVAVALGVLLWFHRRGRLLPLDLFFACWFLAHFALFAALRYRPVRYYLPIVPPMVALAARAMTLLGRRTTLRLPARLAPGALALLVAWLALCLFYVVPAPTPARRAAAAVAMALAAAALAAVVARRLGGRTIAVPGRAAAALFVALPVAASLAVDAAHWGRWAATRRHVIRDTSRELGAAIPGAYVAGLGATTISLENRNRAIHVYEGFFNWRNTFARFPLTHLFMGGFNREVEFWYRRYPAEMARARLVRVVPVKENHYYLHSLVEPTVEAAGPVDAGGPTALAFTVRNNDRRGPRDIDGAVLLRPVGGGADVVLPAGTARAVPSGGTAELRLPGPLPAGAGRLLAFTPPALEHRYEAEFLAHRTGRRLRDARASNGEAWEASTPGIALFGPYQRYPQGLVRAAFRVRLDGPARGPVAVLRVSADSGRTVLAERRIDAADLGTAGAFVDVELPGAALARETPLEFTAETTAGARIVFDRVDVRCTPGLWAADLYGAPAGTASR
jgi:4-amino-4-deoxy-L-arabinose transferase-like glycosyltransferase